MNQAQFCDYLNGQSLFLKDESPLDDGELGNYRGGRSNLWLANKRPPQDMFLPLPSGSRDFPEPSEKATSKTVGARFPPWENPIPISKLGDRHRTQFRTKEQKLSM